MRELAIEIIAEKGSGYERTVSDMASMAVKELPQKIEHDNEWQIGFRKFLMINAKPNQIGINQSFEANDFNKSLIAKKGWAYSLSILYGLDNHYAREDIRVRERKEKEQRFEKEKTLSKDYLGIFSQIIEYDLDWPSIESDFFLKYLSLYNINDEFSKEQIKDEIAKVKADVVKKKGIDYVHAVEKKAMEHANNTYSEILQKHNELVEEEREEVIQQFGDAISTPLVNAILSMNTSNQAQFKQMYTNFENTYRQISLEAVTAITEQNGQYFKKLENTLNSCSLANLEGLERTATMICRAVNGPIPPRQPNEGSVEWFIRMYAQQNCIAPIIPRQEGEGFGSYFARVVTQHNSVMPILPTVPGENIFNYLARLKVTQTL